MQQTSVGMRTDELFMRNNFEGRGRWGIPLIRKQKLDLENLSLIAYSDTKSKDSKKNRKKGVHFFIDDYRFTGVYNNPKKSIGKLSQYAFLITPDYSTYTNMYPWRQMESIAHSRWCGAFWQSKGLLVIPSITWGMAGSFDFCFDGIERGSIVAIGMIGCKKTKRRFMSGYEAMLKRIDPQAIICFGEPFEEMQGNLIVVDYISSRKVVR